MKIVMAHGSGGDMTSALVSDIFAKYYGNEFLAQMEDSTVVSGFEKIAMTTDSFVVDPLVFKGGDIGRLAVCGTVNDLSVRGALPKYLTCGFILEEGLELELLEEISKSIADTCKEAGVSIVTGDTKVINGNGGMYINTSGVGFIDKAATEVSKIEAGDVVLVSGSMGDHHAAILSARLGIDNNIESDVAPLNNITESLKKAEINIHAMRDVTRGGLATVLSEMAEASGKQIEIDEEQIPVRASVKSFAGLMGLDPLYMGNEGKLVAVVDKKDAIKALEIIKNCKYGENAAIVGQVSENNTGELILNTEIGGKRRLQRLSGEGLPRIC